MRIRKEQRHYGKGECGYYSVKLDRLCLVVTQGEKELTDLEFYPLETGAQFSKASPNILGRGRSLNLLEWEPTLVGTFPSLGCACAGAEVPFAKSFPIKCPNFWEIPRGCLQAFCSSLWTAVQAAMRSDVGTVCLSTWMNVNRLYFMINTTQTQLAYTSIS